MLPDIVASVTLSYRSEAFGRGKPKIRDRLKEMSDQGMIAVHLKSNVKLIGKNQLALEQEGKTLEFTNDAVIVCTGDILPTPFLKETGVMVETRFGTA